MPPRARDVDEHGRGLTIVRALAEDVVVRSTSTGSSVAVVVRLARPDGPVDTPRPDQVG